MEHEDGELEFGPVWGASFHGRVDSVAECIGEGLRRSGFGHGILAPRRFGTTSFLKEVCYLLHPNNASDTAWTEGWRAVDQSDVPPWRRMRDKSKKSTVDLIRDQGQILPVYVSLGTARSDAAVSRLMVRGVRQALKGSVSGDAFGWHEALRAAVDEPLADSGELLERIVDVLADATRLQPRRLWLLIDEAAGLFDGRARHGEDHWSTPFLAGWAAALDEAHGIAGATLNTVTALPPALAVRTQSPVVDGALPTYVSDAALRHQWVPLRPWTSSETETFLLRTAPDLVPESGSIHGWLGGCPLLVKLAVAQWRRTPSLRDRALMESILGLPLVRRIRGEWATDLGVERFAGMVGLNRELRRTSDELGMDNIGLVVERDAWRPPTESDPPDHVVVLKGSSTTTTGVYKITGERPEQICDLNAAEASLALVLRWGVEIDHHRYDTM